MAKRKTKKASPGMWLTNGEIYVKEVTPGTWDSVDNYHEISEAEYEAMNSTDDMNDEHI